MPPGRPKKRPGDPEVKRSKDKKPRPKRPQDKKPRPKQSQKTSKTVTYDLSQDKRRYLPPDPQLGTQLGEIMHLALADIAAANPDQSEHILQLITSTWLDRDRDTFLSRAISTSLPFFEKSGLGFMDSFDADQLLERQRRYQIQLSGERKQNELIKRQLRVEQLKLSKHKRFAEEKEGQLRKLESMARRQMEPMERELGLLTGQTGHVPEDNWLAPVDPTVASDPQVAQVLKDVEAAIGDVRELKDVAQRVQRLANMVDK
ncbi:hypothetical protein DICA0_D00276 [Diutina catenulata]